MSFRPSVLPSQARIRRAEAAPQVLGSDRDMSLRCATCPGSLGAARGLAANWREFSCRQRSAAAFAEGPPVRKAD